MRWRKLGLVYVPDGSQAWARTHALFPTAVLRSHDIIRIYYTSLDSYQHGRGSWLDVSSDDPTRILGFSSKPVLELGEIGDFDEAGANPFSIVDFGGRTMMFYQGWQRTSRAPCMIFTGLAFETGSGEFEKYSRIPILDRTPEEIHIRGAPYVLLDGDDLRMWYVSSSKWSGGPNLHYHVAIRQAWSKDGIHWRGDPRICMGPIAEAGEYAVGRPCVLREGGRYRMWYSIRSFKRPYAIGYAESADGVSWSRLDHEAGITRSGNGWDSEMVCYPFVLRVADRLVMFYNGNQHGASGFGCAVLEP